MTTRTRYFVVVSLLVLTVGLGSGLVAYYVGFPAGALGQHAGPLELEYIPRDATVIAFANVHEVMTSDLRQRLRRAVPMHENGQRELQEQTGINIETDLHRAGNNPQAGLESVTGNEELMNLVKSMDDGNAWAVGRFDALRSQAHLPDNVSSQIPAITWFAVNTHINGGIRGTIRAEARDDVAANNLRDVVRGFLALAKMQTNSKPELQAMVDSLEVGGANKTVSIAFMVPSEVFD